MKTHWLHGRGPEKRLDFVREIDVESDCGKCVHRKVCNHKMEDRCENFWFGTSAAQGCHACTHRFTRFDVNDKTRVPCFSCRDFLPETPQPDPQSTT